MKSRLTFTLCFLAGMLILSADVYAIELNPSRNQIDQALEQGFRSARERTPPDQLYAWFGSTQALEPKGFIMTRVVGLRVLATHFALRGELPTEEEIQRILSDDQVVISVVIFGDTPTFAKGSYMLLKQGEKIIKPVNVRFDARGYRTRVWPDHPRYHAKVVGAFRYDSLSPMDPATILAFPAQKGELSFDVDFSTIP